jgi:hypothetical protein
MTFTFIFSKWFDHFVHFVKPSVDDPVLLFVYGLYSHTKRLDVVDKAREHSVAIVSLPPPTQCCHCQSPTTNTVLPLSVSHHQRSVAIVSLPPHSTHKMQPLDVGFTKPLKTCYAQETETWLGNNPGGVFMSFLVCKLCRPS